jgi:sedoheptulose-bisphosphatase
MLNFGLSQVGPSMMAGAVDAKPEGFGASHTSFYTSAKAKDKYATLDEILNSKMADTGVREVVKDMLNACVKITEALRVNLVTVADAQNSVFGDVQLGVDVIADKLMWEACKTSKVVQTGASEEEPVLVEVNKDGRFVVCWDPLDGSSIVDNNWAVGTMIGTQPLATRPAGTCTLTANRAAGIWDKKTGMLGATGRDQVPRCGSKLCVDRRGPLGREPCRIGRLMGSHVS